jgi:hypothetical protein
MIYKLAAAALVVASGEALKLNGLGLSRRVAIAQVASLAVPLASAPAFAELMKASDGDIYKVRALNAAARHTNHARGPHSPRVALSRCYGAGPIDPRPRHPARCLTLFFACIVLHALTRPCPQRADEGGLNSARAIERAKSGELVDGSSATCSELDALIAIDREAVQFEKDKLGARFGKDKKVVEDTKNELQGQIDKLKKLRKKKRCNTAGANLKQPTDFEVYKVRTRGEIPSDPLFVCDRAVGTRRVPSAPSPG